MAMREIFAFVYPSLAQLLARHLVGPGPVFRRLEALSFLEAPDALAGAEDHFETG